MIAVAPTQIKELLILCHVLLQKRKIKEKDLKTRIWRTPFQLIKLI